MSNKYQPIFLKGSAIPQPFDTHSALVGVFQNRAEGDVGGHWWHLVRDVLLPGDRVLLESLRMEIVLSIGQSSAPTAFICLGKKQSGDIYTSTDLALLSTVSHKLSDIMRNFKTEGPSPLDATPQPSLFS